MLILRLFTAYLLSSFCFSIRFTSFLSRSSSACRKRTLFSSVNISPGSESYESKRLFRAIGSPVLVVLPDTDNSSNRGQKIAKYNNTIHLIGVSHGSPPSAKLVRDTVINIKKSIDQVPYNSEFSQSKAPIVLALELCNDRYLSIALEAKVFHHTITTLNIHFHDINTFMVTD